MTTLKETYLLQMRVACANMEHANQCAARDMARGEWQCDWSVPFQESLHEFNEALACLKTIPDWQD